MAAEILRAEGVSRLYRGTPVVREVNLSLAEGEGICLLGGNGAGKTTLLRMAATLLRPSAGALYYRGAPAAEAMPEARAWIGYLGHESLLYPELTLRENLDFHRRLHGAPTSVADALRRHRLTGAADLPTRFVSRGTGQRAALARALLHDPDLLLFDEPFTGLDGPARDRLIDLLGEARSRGAALLLATHDLERGLAVADRAVVLRRGAVALDDPRASVAEVRAAYAGL